MEKLEGYELWRGKEESMRQSKDLMQYRDCMKGCTLNCIKCMDRMECMQARNWMLLNRRKGARGQGLQEGNDPLLRKFLIFLSENHVFYFKLVKCSNLFHCLISYH